MATLPNMLTVQQAADELGVTDGRIRQIILAGQLPAVRIGERVLLIDRRDLERLRKKRMAS